jgi:hypothetical protein
MLIGDLDEFEDIRTLGRDRAVHIREKCDAASREVRARINAKTQILAELNGLHPTVRLLVGAVTLNR